MQNWLIDNMPWIKNLYIEMTLEKFAYIVLLALCIGCYYVWNRFKKK